MYEGKTEPILYLHQANSQEFALLTVFRLVIALSAHIELLLNVRIFLMVMNSPAMLWASAPTQHVMAGFNL